MIARLSGTLIEKSPSHIVVDCGGIGFRMSVSLTTSEQLPSVGEHAIVHTHLIVRDDGIELVGFATPSEREMFLLLIAIPGVGTRIALSILSAMSVAELQHAVLANNLVVLQRIPGVGKKTAERLVLELREKIASVSIEREGVGEFSLLLSEALQAMVVLGYNRAQAEKALRTAFETMRQQGQSPSVETLIKHALRILHQIS